MCWRAKSSIDLPVLETLPDGSYISKLSDPVAANKRRDQVRKHVRNLVDVPGHRVRVIEYQVTDRDGAEAEPETYRLVTTLLDPDEVPATELCSLEHCRWELESTFNEIKTSQRGARIVLRSKSPPTVYSVLRAPAHPPRRARVDAPRKPGRLGGWCRSGVYGAGVIASDGG